MARRILLSLMIPISACAAWWLRGLELSISFSGSGLPLPLTRWGWALWGLLGAVALLTALLSLPEKDGSALSNYRSFLPGAVLQGAGALLIAAGGAWQLYQLYPVLRSLEAIAAMAMILGALGLFGGLRACLGGKSRAGGLLLLSMCGAAGYLVLTYLEVSADPILRHFEMRMLTLGAAALAAIALCSLAFGAGGRRWFLLFSALTVPLSAAALYTSGSYARALGLMGCMLAAFGFFLSVLFGIPAKGQPKYELVDDPFHTGSIRREDIREAAESSSDTVSTAPPVISAAEPLPQPLVEKVPEKASVTPLPAPSTPLAPKAEDTAPQDDFDLARVDRLLRELEADQTPDI